MIISGGFEDCDESKWDGGPGIREGNEGVAEGV